MKRAFTGGIHARPQPWGSGQFIGGNAYKAVWNHQPPGLGGREPLRGFPARPQAPWSDRRTTSSYSLSFSKSSLAVALVPNYLVPSPASRLDHTSRPTHHYSSVPILRPLRPTIIHHARSLNVPTSSTGGVFAHERKSPGRRNRDSRLDHGLAQASFPLRPPSSMGEMAFPLPPREGSPDPCLTSIRIDP